MAKFLTKKVHHLKSIKFLLLFLFSSSSFSATQYVSDELSIFMHSGPSLEYRIIGSIQVGTAVDALKYNEETKFMQIKSDTGRIGWVKSSELQREIPAKTLLPKVQKELSIAQDKLKTINDKHNKELALKVQEITDKNGLIFSLEKEKQALQESIVALEEENKNLDLMQETKDQRIKMEWLMFGGSILFFGIIFGLIIPFLPRRKKRTNNW